MSLYYNLYGEAQWPNHIIFIIVCLFNISDLFHKFGNDAIED